MKTPRLICCTDFSANAQSATDVAAAIASRLGARLALVHVADETNAHAASAAGFQAHIAPIKRQLQREAKRLRRRGLQVDPVLLNGRWAEDAIIDFIVEEPPALVVVASVSKTAFDRWTLGSVSERIAQRSPAPTLVVRAPAALVAWARTKASLKLFVAANFSRSAEAALDYVNTLRGIGPCEATVTHVNWPPDASRLLPPGEPLGLAGNPPLVQRHLLDKLEKSVATYFKPAGTRLCVQPAWGRADAALASAATSAEADLVVVGTHQRQGVRRLARASISRGLLRHAPMNVVCVPVVASLTSNGRPPPQIRHVVAATDFSAAGNAAVLWAYATLPAGGRVKLVHVVPPHSFSGPLPTDAAASRQSVVQHRRFVAEANAKLRALVPPEGSVRRIVSDVEVIEDRDPAAAICRTAELFNADVVCVGTQGHSAIGAALLGSVAHKVMERSPCPVLTIRPPAS